MAAKSGRVRFAIEWATMVMLRGGGGDGGSRRQTMVEVVVVEDTKCGDGGFVLCMSREKAD